MMIISRKLANELGGWRDLDRHEDSDISARALSAKRYVQNFSLNVVKAHLKKMAPPVMLSSFRLTYLDCRDWYRIGMPLMTGLKRGRLPPLTFLSYILSRFMERYPNQNIPEYLEILSTDKYYGHPTENHG